jgi:hypothetical protein
MFLSFDVVAPTEWFEKKNRCYFVWLFEKAPEIVVEVVSNKVGGENEGKMEIYARMGVLYYVLIDPYLYLYKQRLNVFRLEGKTYQAFETDNLYMPEIDLGIKIWQGLFEKHEAPWARWCSKEGNVLKTGAERTFELSAQNSELSNQNSELSNQNSELSNQNSELSNQNSELSNQNSELSNQNSELAEQLAKEQLEKAQEQQRVEKLMAQLAALGLKPDA